MLSVLPDPEILATSVSSTAQRFLEFAVGIAIVLLIVCAIMIRKRWGTSMGFVILGAAGLGSGVEVIFNTAANFWYYQVGQDDAFTTWERSTPIWALGSYVPFYGGLGMLGWYLLERGLSRRGLTLYAVGVWVFAMITEVSLVGIGVYQYYGPQPYEIADFPIWISAANAGICTTIAIGAASLSRVNLGIRQWLLILVGPCITGSFLIGTAFPGILVLQSDNPSTAALYLGGALASLLAAGVTFVVLGAVPPGGFPTSLRGKDSGTPEAWPGQPVAAERSSSTIGQRT